jgi:hypothetical protein
MTQIIYNNANAEERTKQLHNAKVEESKIQEWSKTHLKTFRNRFRKAKRVGLEPTKFAFITYTKSHDGYYLSCM